MKNNRTPNFKLQTYYPFGYPIAERSWTGDGYRFGFNGQEKDDEIYGEGVSYTAEFWQYDSRVGRRWNVDPVSSKYPSLSPYVFVTNSPIMLIDPDGRVIIAANAQTQAYMKQYFTTQFGTDNMFRFKKNGELRINKSEYKSYMRAETTSASQKHVLSGFKDAINQKDILRLHITNQNNFQGNFVDYTFDADGNPTGYANLPQNINMQGQSAVTVQRMNNAGGTDYYIFMNDVASGTESVSGSTVIGKDDRIEYSTGQDASSVFVHEVLDEFLDFYSSKNTNNNSPQKDKVKYQNSALRNVGKRPRDGKDHQ